MKISYKGDYALKAMLYLTVNYNSQLITSNDMSKMIDAPVKFLEQVLLELKKGGFVQSMRGKNGGYMLSKSPNLITVGDVVRFIEGPVEPIACINKNYVNCRDLKKCVFKKIWQQVALAISGIIDNVTFEQLAKDFKSNKNTANYYSI